MTENESLGEHLALCARSSLCDVITRPSLMQLLKREDLDGFRDALEEASEEQINAQNQPEQYTCLEYASDHGLQEFVSLLLDHGANPDQHNAIRYGTALHFAARKGHSLVLKALLDYTNNVNSVTNRGRTPVHLVVEGAVTHIRKQGPPPPTGYVESLQALSEHPLVEKAVRDRTGATPLHLAVKGDWKLGVQLLLEQGADLEAEVDGRTTRDLLQEKFPDLLDSLVCAELFHPKKDKLFFTHQMFDALYKAQTGIFLQLLAEAAKNSMDLNSSDGSFTFLQYSCQQGYDDCVKILLESGADPNAVSQGNGCPPALLAATHGYHKCLHHLLSYSNLDLFARDSTSRQTILHKLALRRMTELKVNDQDFDICIDEVLEYPVDINAQDIVGNTPLHYAARNGSARPILTLLKHGACLVIKNMPNEPPISSIPPVVLKEFLDECLQSDRDPTSDQFQVTFEYNFLAPNRCNREDLECTSDIKEGFQNVTNKDSQNLPETEPLWYLWQSKKHQHLLKHPVISSFLYLKFQCIRIFFYINLFLNVLYVLSLSYYLNTKFGYSVEHSNSSTVGEVTDYESRKISPYLLYFLTTLVTFMIIREAFQLAVSIKRYLISFENMCEVILIVLTCLIMYSSLDSITKHHLAPLVLLLAWSELLFILGQHPVLSTYMTMFATVSLSYIGFLATFSLLICAFAMCFSLLFHTCPEESDECDSEAFQYFPMAFLRTCVMMIGEFEFGSLPFSLLPGTSQVVFSLFLFLIVMVLLNLMNGLAVSDTQAIRERAELVGCGSRLNLISYVECTLLGDPLHFFSKWGSFRWMKRLPDCTFYTLCHRTPQLRRLLQKLTFGRKTLLFPYLPKGQLTVTFADAVKVYPSQFHLDSNITDAAKALVEARNKSFSDSTSDLDVRERLDRIERKVEQLIGILGGLSRRPPDEVNFA